MFLGDIIITPDEIKGLSRDPLVSKSRNQPPAGTLLSEWLKENAGNLGRRYASEVKRHYRS